MSRSAIVFDRVMLARRRRRAAALGPATFLIDRVAQDLADRLATVLRRFELAVDLGTPGDAIRCVLDRALEYLTGAVVSVLHIFDPEVLIIGGSIAEAGPQLLAPIRGEVARRTRILLGREVPIVFQSLVGYGGVAGAAGLVFLQQGLLKI